MKSERRDIEYFDAFADHLIVLDKSKTLLEDQVVGTYRLLRQNIVQKHGRFYTSDEYDITPLLNTQKNLLELGRSCVHTNYRVRPVLQLLWKGIANYMLDHNADILFGCASLRSTDLKEHSKALAYLHHNHLAPQSWRPKAIEARYIDMNLHPPSDLDFKTIFRELPPLIKGYLRTGAMIGDGAVMDEQFNTIDVCIILPLDQLSSRYRTHYSRKVNRDIPINEAIK